MEAGKTQNNNLSKEKLITAIRSFVGIAILWLILLLLFRIVEISVVGNPTQFLDSIKWSFLSDLFFWMTWLLPLFLLYAAIFQISERLAKLILYFILAIFFVIHAALSLYFKTSSSLAGADIYGYSQRDIIQTVGASGNFNFVSGLLVVALVALVVATLVFGQRYLKSGTYLSVCLLVLSFFLLFFASPTRLLKPRFDTDFENDLVVNKSDHFFKASYAYFFPSPAETDIYSESYIGNFGGNANAVQFEYVDEANFPFLHRETTSDVLTPFFKPASTSPNIVILLMEGLGRAYSNEGAYLGSFTPFLDSLSEKSLYWENFLSQQGRTFAVLPSVLGSLPFAKNGFLELGAKMPAHLSLLNLLQANGYQSSFHAGGSSSFDNMNQYLEMNGIGRIMDQKTFPSSYIMLPEYNGFSWGMNDKELFRHYFATTPINGNKVPKLDVLLTVASHNPFIINETAKYQQLFEDRLTSLRIGNQEKITYRKYKNQYVSILYADDAVRDFMVEYAKRPDYENTIFIITGDHRIPEIPMRTKIDRYHVPLIIFSPLLKRTAKISSVSTHFDIAPSILAYLSNNYQIKIPNESSWLGSGLDTTKSFQNLHAVPLIQNKSDIVDFIQGEHHLNGNTLFKLMPDMNEVVSKDEKLKEQLQNSFNLFKRRNELIINGKKLAPDSLITKFTNPG